MEFPLFGFCEGDLCVFSSIGAARAEMELEDVRNSCWKIYDRNGQVLTVRVTSRPLCRWFPVFLLKSERLELAETGEWQTKVMCDQLRRYLQAIPNDDLTREQIAAASCQELVRLAMGKKRREGKNR
jgi:hypothetical protein